MIFDGIRKNKLIKGRWAEEMENDNIVMFIPQIISPNVKTKTRSEEQKENG